MKPAEKRKFLRLDALHLLDFLIIDEAGNQCEYSMGRTLDVSINGIKMETVEEIPLKGSLLITLGIEDNLIDVSGVPVHTSKADNRHISGIEFNEVAPENRAVLRSYVDEFQARKDALLRKNDFPPMQANVV